MPTLRRTIAFAVVVTSAACAGDPSGAAAPWRTGAAADSSGTTQAAFVARDADGPAAADQRFPPSIFVRCDGDGTSVYVDWRTDLGRDTVATTWTLDDGPERVEEWVASADQRAAGRWSDPLARPLLDDLMAHDQLQVRVDAESGPQTRTFPLDGLREASEALREMCDGDRGPRS